MYVWRSNSDILGEGNYMITKSNILKKSTFLKSKLQQNNKNTTNSSSNLHTYNNVNLWIFK